MDTPREKLNLTKEQGRELIWGDLPEFEVISDSISGQNRWSTFYTSIVKRKSDNKYFKGGYSKGSTECQGERPFEDEAPDFYEVFPVEKKVIVCDHSPD